MRRWALRIALASGIGLVLVGQCSAQRALQREALWHHRNLGKALYENPTTHAEAVEEFRKALELAPNSARERVNYGLALLRDGKVKEGIVELERSQKQDPTIPHTWFNLGIEYKKAHDYKRSRQQFERMIALVPDEPVSHYNLGVLLRLAGEVEPAIKQFETAAELKPYFAAPHFQLHHAFRERGREKDAEREWQIFSELRKRQAGAAVPEDPEWSYYSEIYDAPDDETDLADGPSGLEFVLQNVASGVDAATAGMAVLDVDHDGRPDLVVWSRNGVLLLKEGRTPVAAGLDDLKDVFYVAPGDFNNDGFPDLAVLTASGPLLYLNRGGSRLEKYPSSLPAGRFTKAVWIDYDHDYDLDLVLLGEHQVLLRNEGQAGFTDHSADFPFVPAQAVDGKVFDLFPDSNEMDLAVVYSDGNIVLYHDRLGGHFEAVPLQTGFKVPMTLLARDFNNDGWTDLVVATQEGPHLLFNKKGKLQSQDGLPGGNGSLAVADFANRGVSDLLTGGTVFWNRGSARFEPAKITGLDHVVIQVAADFDGDGNTSLAVVTTDGHVALARNAAPSRHSWLRVTLEGTKNLKLASGAMVEVKAGALYQKQMYQGVPLTFGMRSYAGVDTVRITWPNGLVQNETKQSVGTALAFREKPRLSGSCPTVFAWNGARFEFVTDVLGVAPLGASDGEGHYFPVNDHEYVQISRRALVEAGGGYQLRITEELHEVSYIDEVRLFALDHPADMDVYTNEKFKSPPYPEFRLFGARQKVHPLRAHDEGGHDVRAELMKRDGRYVGGFPRDYLGQAAIHYLDLDFGDAVPDNRAILVLNGWVDWADGSTFLNARQSSSEGLVFPYLQVKDRHGKWQTVVADMGIPSGKTKTIVVDLEGKFLSEAREVRIVTGLCVYWDEIFLAKRVRNPALKMTALPLQSADLRFRGFSRPVLDLRRRQPERFDYDRWMPVSNWNPTPGFYTRYGDVRRLLTAADDQMVIMGSGDEIQLQFDAVNSPALKPGWTRDFLLLVDGWAKDSDPNTAFSRSVEPLPFHNMSRYPYGENEHFPNDDLHREYLQSYNRRPAPTLLAPLRPRTESRTQVERE
jgi:tetratricopeptide (TPR) repeat protein